MSSNRPENQPVHKATRMSLENIMKAMLVEEQLPGVDENERRINEDRMQRAFFQGVFHSKKNCLLNLNTTDLFESS